MDPDETVDVDEPKEKKTQTRTPKLTPLTDLYDSSHFSDWKTAERKSESNDSLKIETIVFDQKLTGEETAEEVAAYDASVGSYKAFIYYRKKKIHVPFYSLARHRKKPRAGKDFKDKTYFELSHAQAAELRKAPTHMKDGATMDSKYDWVSDELAPGCVWALEVPVNLNEGFKIMGPEGKVVNAPEEWRYFPRMFVGRLVAIDEAGENEQAIEGGELLPVPPSIQLKWLNDDTIERGNSLDKVFNKENLEKTFTIPIKFDIKNWTDSAKENDGKKPRTTNPTNDDDKKEKKPVKRKADAKTENKLITKAAEPKSKTTDAKIPESKAPSSKRLKTDATSSDPPPDNVIAQLAEEARKQGKTLTMYKMVIS